MKLNLKGFAQIRPLFQILFHNNTSIIVGQNSTRIMMIFDYIVRNDLLAF